MVTLTEHVCGECGCVFGMEEGYYQARRRDHRTWYCPNGHPRAFKGESEEEKLRRERNQLKQQIAYKDDRIREERERAEHERRRAIGYKGHATKLAKRAKAGVCPCCKRSFVNVARHMASKHPNFGPPVEHQEGETVQ